MTVIRVVCGEPSHEGKTVNVIEFASDPERRWMAMWGHTPRRRPRPGADTSDAQLVHVARSSEEPGSNGRYRLVCDLCGLSFIRYEDPLFELLDTLDRAGVSEVSLAALVATVRK